MTVDYRIGGHIEHVDRNYEIFSSWRGDRRGPTLRELGAKCGIQAMTVRAIVQKMRRQYTSFATKVVPAILRCGPLADGPVEFKSYSTEFRDPRDEYYRVIDELGMFGKAAAPPVSPELEYSLIIGELDLKLKR